jgi:hypothetical protein
MREHQKYYKDNKMNKTLLSLASLAFSISCAHAYTPRNACDYKDTLSITDATAPAATHILGEVRATNGAQITDLTSSSFVIKGLCAPGSTDTTVNVTFGTSPENSCALTIQDGQFTSDPIIQSVTCTGNLVYTGITYDGLMSYSYKLHFSIK